MVTALFVRHAATTPEPRSCAGTVISRDTDGENTAECRYIYSQLRGKITWEKALMITADGRI
jgi:hypothetical protein